MQRTSVSPTVPTAPLEAAADPLARIAAALERLSPPPPPPADLAAHAAFIWRAETARLQPVPRVSHVPLGLLVGIERQRNALVANTRRFAVGRPANNALLWGARGMGKSSLVKAVHAELSAQHPALKLIEIAREDIAGLPDCLAALRDQPVRAIVFCDDLSFEAGDTTYKALKAALEGGLEGRPANAVLYATSNRRHLMPRAMIENEQASAISPGEAVDENVSLSDRFGLWLGFHHCSQADYLAMVAGYAEASAAAISGDALAKLALAFAAERGARSGRVAWQFMQSLD